MKAKQDIEVLFHKYVSGLCSPQEVAELMQLFNLDHEQQLNELLIGHYSKGAENEVFPEVPAHIFTSIQDRINPKPQRLWRKFAIAAAVATMIFGAGLFVYRNHSSLNPAAGLVAGIRDVAPGRPGASITLASGQVIQLSGDQKSVLVGTSLEYADRTAVLGKDSAAIFYAASGTLMASTAAGQTYQFVLGDGSRVHLNAGSSLRFPAKFSGALREVSLHGEGFFEVAKDAAHPFVVESAGQKIEVLGTQFNINSYADEGAVKTTLLEGSVKVQAAGASKLLVPGQQAQYRGGNLNVVQADLANVLDWKNDEFILDGQSLVSSMNKIARWYNLEIVYAADVPKQLELGGVISRNSRLSAVLQLIEATGVVNFKIEGRKLYVSN